MTLGQRIQEHRLRLGLSQEALGEKLGVSRQAVSKWEGDAAVPDTDKLIALSKLFGLTLNELLQVEGPEAGQAAENAEEIPQSEPQKEPKPGKKKMRAAPWLIPVLAVLALVLGLTAVVVSFGQRTNDLQYRIARLELRVNQLETASALDPADLVGDWDLGIGSGVYSIDSTFYRDVPVTVALTRYDPNQPFEVFFQVYGSGLEEKRVEAYPVEETSAGVYSAQVPVQTGNPGTLAVGFRINGVEDLQPLVEITGMTDHSISCEPLLPTAEES